MGRENYEFYIGLLAYIGLYTVQYIHTYIGPYIHTSLLIRLPVFDSCEWSRTESLSLSLSLHFSYSRCTVAVRRFCCMFGMMVNCHDDDVVVNETLLFLVLVIYMLVYSQREWAITSRSRHYSQRSPSHQRGDITLGRGGMLSEREM